MAGAIITNNDQRATMQQPRRSKIIKVTTKCKLVQNNFTIAQNILMCKALKWRNSNIILVKKQQDYQHHTKQLDYQIKFFSKVVLKR